MEENLQTTYDFNYNVNSGIIEYNKGGLEKLSNEDTIILNTNDPIGNKVVLWNHTFQKHILAEHKGNDSRYYLSYKNNFQRIIAAINSPQYILEDKEREDRLEFITLTDIENNGKISLKSLSVITEKSTTVESSLEIVTVIPKRIATLDITNRRVIYNVNSHTNRI